MVVSEPTRSGSPSLFSATIGRIGLLPRFYFGGSSLQVTFPEWFYDLCVLVFFLFNWVVATAAARFPRSYVRKDWPLDPNLGPRKLPPPRQSLDDLSAIIRRRDNTPLDDDSIWNLFDSLPPPATNEMFGTWRGKVLRSGSILTIPSVFGETPNRWIGCDWGKRFLTPYKGDPLIWIGWKKLIVPLPVWGNVSMPESSMRGEVGATMVYDHQPWQDHFRILDDGKISGRRMLLGMWMSREKNGGWFTLEEMPELDEGIRPIVVPSPYRTVPTRERAPSKVAS